MSSIGFIDWLLDLLGLRQGSPASHELSETVTEVNPASGSIEEYVVTPYGYRIRVPQPQDVSHSVGEMLPDVRESLAQIPPLPLVVTELLREVQNANSTADSVAQIVASDPVLAAALLRTVNSAAMGLNRKITSVTEAVSYLGFSLVKSVLIRLRLDEALPTQGQAATDAEDLWIHSLATSYVAEVLAERIPGVDRGFVSTLGLLHDIGKLAMLSQGRLHDLLAASSLSEDARSTEARLLGTDHAGLGAALAHAWGLPADLVRAIRFHHHPEQAFETTDPLPLRKAMQVVFIANQLAKFGYAHADGIEIAPTIEAAKMLGLSESVETMLDSKVRSAIARAILFAAENSQQPKAAVKRLLRLREGRSVLSIPDMAVTCVQIDEAYIAELFHKSTDATSFFRATASTVESDIVKLIIAGSFHQSKLALPPSLHAIANEVLRCLLPNLISRSGDETVVELIQQFDRRVFTMAIRGDALRFSHRLGEAGSTEQGMRVLQSDFAGMINLGWVRTIRISADGSRMALEMPVQA